MIKYTERSMGVTEDGCYLVDVKHVNPNCCEKVVADASVSSDGHVTWSQLGIDYDVWTYSDGNWELEVVCKLDLDKIAEAAHAQR